MSMKDLLRLGSKCRLALHKVPSHGGGRGKGEEGRGEGRRGCPDQCVLRDTQARFGNIPSFDQG